MANRQNERIYEIGLHIIPTIDEGKVSTVFEDIRKAVAEDVEVLGEESPEHHNLAYTVRHAVRKGDGSYDKYGESYFGSIKFKTLQEHVKKVRRYMQDNENILRFLILETVTEDTRIGEVLPGEEQKEHGEAPDQKSGVAEKEGKDSSGGQGSEEAGDKK